MSSKQRRKARDEYRAQMEARGDEPIEIDPMRILYHILDMRKIAILESIIADNTTAAILEIAHGWPEYYEESDNDDDWKTLWANLLEWAGELDIPEMIIEELIDDDD